MNNMNCRFAGTTIFDNLFRKERTAWGMVFKVSATFIVAKS